jgi:hypothetical protein
MINSIFAVFIKCFSIIMIVYSFVLIKLVDIVPDSKKNYVIFVSGITLIIALVMKIKVLPFF